MVVGGRSFSMVLSNCASVFFARHAGEMAAGPGNLSEFSIASFLGAMTRKTMFFLTLHVSGPDLL
jgi:hypothetical protein